MSFIDANHPLHQSYGYNTVTCQFSQSNNKSFASQLLAKYGLVVVTSAVCLSCVAFGWVIGSSLSESPSLYSSVAPHPSSSSVAIPLTSDMQSSSMRAAPHPTASRRAVAALNSQIEEMRFSEVSEGPLSSRNFAAYAKAPLLAGLAALLLVPATAAAWVMAIGKKQPEPEPHHCCNCCAQPGVPYYMLSMAGEPIAAPAADSKVRSKWDLIPDDDEEEEKAEKDKLSSPYIPDMMPEEPRCSAFVYRDGDGKLKAGCGHILNEEECLLYKEGDVVDDDTIHRWMERDGKLAYFEDDEFDVENYSNRVVQDEDGYLVAGFRHRLTEKDLKRWKEGDRVDSETILTWFEADSKAGLLEDQDPNELDSDEEKELNSMAN